MLAARMQKRREMIGDHFPPFHYFYLTRQCEIHFMLILEQTQDPPGLDIDININRSRPLRQARHGAHGAQDRIEEAGADARPDIADRYPETGGPVLQSRIV